VPEECAYLDTVHEVQLVHVDDMPCDDPVGNNQVRTECFQGGVIYLNEALDDVLLTEASVHGWIHGLAECADGDWDHDHLRSELWATYGMDTIEFQALWMAEIGSCL